MFFKCTVKPFLTDSWTPLTSIIFICSFSPSLSFWFSYFGVASDLLCPTKSPINVNQIRHTVFWERLCNITPHPGGRLPFIWKQLSRTRWSQADSRPVPRLPLWCQYDSPGRRMFLCPSVNAEMRFQLQTATYGWIQTSVWTKRCKKWMFEGSTRGS